MNRTERGTVTIRTDVDTLSFPWGNLNFLSEPSISGIKSMCCATVRIEPGQGHGRHNHPGTDEFIYVIAGQAEQVLDDQPSIRIGPGSCVIIPTDVFHSTMNVGASTLELMVVYSPCGPENLLRSMEDCTVIPAGQ
ncbi:cupin domain-containing protein [Deinococcus rubellus]|uniref:cupin domain-containing protein n=1 Tax=Deinococcus rubellus TaxID=1889240 RepID=UPI0031F08464